MKLTAFTLLLLFPFIVTAQPKPAPEYPQDYFRNPLDVPIFLAGNFGECRPGHFHSGVDIKTQGKENLPVHAAADGYISRIKMEKGGFGHGLYITHPNGYTTLYAHLNDFAPDLQRHLRKEQYARKRWDVDLSFGPEQFPVKKGQLVAYSGNTGASTAPHLHFEIRNTKTEHPLNPELFGLPVVDNIAATPIDIALYDLGKSIYEQDAVIIPLKKDGNKYAPAKAANENLHLDNGTVITDYVVTGIGINVDDYMDGSDNTISFLTTRLYVDDSLQSEVLLDNVGYDETRYINAYTDFKTRTQKRKWIQCLFKLPGNHLDSIYRYLNSNMGGITLTASGVGEQKPHEIRIVITDDKGNASTISFPIKMIMGPRHPNMEQGNTTKFAVGQQNSVNDPNVAFSLDAKQLYDDINFAFGKTPGAGFSDKYQLHYPYVPLHHYFDLQIKPNKTVPLSLRNKVVMMYSDDKDDDGRAAVFSENGWYKARVRNFGKYWLDIDTTAPTVHGMQKNGANLAKAKQIAIEVKDAITSVKSYSGYIDGKWVCFEQHGNTCFYKFDEHCGKGKHKLVFKAEDENGNEVVYELTFTR